MKAPKYPIRFAVVDDDANDRRMIIRLVEKAGAYVCVGTYRSANEALTEIPKIRPDLVLMDIRMPGISGLECMHLLKYLMPGLIVVLVSGLTDPETMSAALAAGGDGYLTKPFTASQCLATLTFAAKSRSPGSGEGAA